jgi:hypothetical protein
MMVGIIFPFFPLARSELCLPFWGKQLTMLSADADTGY